MRFKIKGQKIHIHWSLLFLFFWFLLHNYSLPFVFAGFFSSFIIIFLHEAGHCITAIKMGYSVSEIVIFGWGGECRYEELNYKKDDFIISSSGVLFQMFLGILSLGVYLILYHLFHLNSFLIRFLFLYQFVYINCFLIILNLLPVPGFDGAKMLEAYENPFTKYFEIKIEKYNNIEAKKGRLFQSTTREKKQARKRVNIQTNGTLKNQKKFSKEELSKLTENIMDEIKSQSQKSKDSTSN